MPLQSLLALALALGALCRLPPVPVVAVADVAVVYLHLDAGGNYCGSCKAVRTCKNTKQQWKSTLSIFKSGAAVLL